MRRSLAAAVAVLMLGGVVAPGLLSACAQARRACCVQDVAAPGGMDRPPCCAPVEVRVGIVSPAVQTEKIAKGPMRLSLVAFVTAGQLLSARPSWRSSRAPEFARGLGPPLHLRI